MKELFVVYEYEKISFLVALKTPQKSEKSMGETSRLRSESLALSQFSEISFLVQLAKSVTVVDTISTTVIFYLFPFWGCFWKETGDISNISSHKHIVCPDSMRPWSEKTGLGKMTIVIRI